ncbi:MAG: PIN domain-containing protein [Bacteroidota bacterium]
MKVIVDTCIWSLALRRSKETFIPEKEELIQLIDQGRVIVLGPVRQEILSGIKEPKQFEKLSTHLASFPDHQINSSDYETAASYFNKCKAKGMQGSNTDFLICAVASNNDFSIFTTDQDFTRFKKYLPIKLHKY